MPIVGPANWRSAFLPGSLQGTHIDTQHADVTRLIENIRHTAGTAAEQRRQLDLVRLLNEKHRAAQGDDGQLEARIQVLELAYRMQFEAAEAFDITREPTRVRERYGTGIHGRHCSSPAGCWSAACASCRRGPAAGSRGTTTTASPSSTRTCRPAGTGPIAAFLDDLKVRSLFDSTLVLWSGEFGRTPVAELPGLSGRDHNHYGFSTWLAGGGVKGGLAYGATDEFGFRAVEKKVTSRPARHHFAFDGVRPREADVPPRRPRLPPDRRAWQRGQGTARLTRGTRGLST